MSVPRNIADVIRQHVTLEVEGIDRLYLNICQPKLHTEKQAACFSATIAASPSLARISGLRSIPKSTIDRRICKPFGFSCSGLRHLRGKL